MDLPTTGYTGHVSMYRMPTTQVNHRKDPFFNINSLRPRLNMEEEAPQKTAEEKASASEKSGAGGNTPLNSSGYRSLLGVPNKQYEMRLPAVGYTGHRMGYKSQNFYGKNYKDCSI